ncbi:uncharacterized protein K02A2.6-like [Homalodisca vitripennis]|uniref:uncharacterized protein K02A2.6-like n=1 Tax=Homalodisca vitripennis TaxID=197043 RepID=UPI001EEA5010|nr:uncharacterized protein K02A2.6-like [Homalodisca vitripennis]
MDRDIAARVRSCQLCSLSKPAQNAKLGLLSSEVAERPLEKLFIDYVGAFPRCKSGNKFLLVCVDAFSKFVWLFPLRSATAQLTTKVLRTNIFQHFGIPTTIVSDNGTQFLSNEFKRMCFGHGIRHVTTSPYYPQPSHAERFNRNLRSALIAFHAKNHETWDQEQQERFHPTTLWLIFGGLGTFCHRLVLLMLLALGQLPGEIFSGLGNC